MKWNCRLRCVVVCLGLTILFSLFSYRLVHLQVTLHDKMTELAAQNHGVRVPIPAERGQIYDASGEVLAHNIPGQMVIADASLVRDAEALTAMVADTLQLPFDDVAQKLTSDSKYTVLKHSVPEEVAEALKAQLLAKNLRGIQFQPEPRREYPNGSILCHAIGFVDFEGKGIEGVEKSMDDYLRGEDGYRYIEKNRKGREIVPYRGTERAPRHGQNVHLTVDVRLQKIVEDKIDDAMREYRPEKAVIILMRPGTGEILAMATRPNFDLNQRATAKPEQMKNRAVLDMIEPGSTFKIVTAAAALNEHKYSPDSYIFCENGLWNYGGRPLHDHAPYGDLSVQSILIKSSNIGAAKLALSVGDQKFYEYIRNFGFGDRTGVELPGEIIGRVNAPHLWQKISITRISMGQGISVTPLQMTAAMAAIANGGKLVEPRIVKSISDSNGQTVSEFKPTVVRQVVSEKTAAQVGNALRGVVNDGGTASGVEVPGFTICGKTGTAQKIATPGPGYEPGKYIVSFLGYLPAENPEFVGLVLLDDAKTTAEKNYGGKVAAPIFAEIAKEVVRALDLEPHEEIRKAVAVGQVALTTSAHRR